MSRCRLLCRVSRFRMGGRLWPWVCPFWWRWWLRTSVFRLVCVSVGLRLCGLVLPLRLYL